MAINIQHTHFVNACILYDNTYHMIVRGTMDDLCELACDNLVRHNLHTADITDNETGEVLAIVTRD